MTAPDGSVTVPRTAPVSTWASARIEDSSIAARNRNPPLRGENKLRDIGPPERMCTYTVRVRTRLIPSYYPCQAKNAIDLRKTIGLILGFELKNSVPSIQPVRVRTRFGWHGFVKQ